MRKWSGYRWDNIIYPVFLLLLILAAFLSGRSQRQTEPVSEELTEKLLKENTLRDLSEDAEKKLIRYVEFPVTLAALELAYQFDKSTYGEAVHLNWVDLLAYTSARTGASYSGEKWETCMREGAEKLLSGEETTLAWEKQYTYFSYYQEAYQAILGGMLGEYGYEEEDGEEVVFKTKYGLKAYSPVARYFYYEDYDDFGASRSYGYRRRHLGHDMLGQTGTPITAVESGIIEALGWNQYGGWRIGIRSFDGKRYYYYAHLRKNWPYVKSLKEGDIVTAGDVIGYMGRTGYSTRENVNNIEKTHLHFGLQLVFDESQKECDNEIWIDCFALSRFLLKHRSEAVKQEDGEWVRKYEMTDPAETEYRKKNNMP